MKKILMWVGIVFVVLIIIGIISGEDSPKQRTISTSATSNDAAISDETNRPKEVEVTSNLTGPQGNAVRSAEQYISMTGFSREGLIQQLSSSAGSGYELADATVAVDSLNIDWNEQAVRSAKQYLEMSGFSCSGLVEQLSSAAGSHYTVDQARYGAQQAGACS